MNGSNDFQKATFKINPDECYFLTSTTKTVKINIEGIYINSNNKEISLGIKNDLQLSFEIHVSSIYKKASQRFYHA